MSNDFWQTIGDFVAAEMRGAEQERERIIELLETWGEEAGCYCCASDAAAADIIDLIKGEQK